MSKQISDGKTIPFRGGVDTVREIILIPSGKYSVLQNFRSKYPGFEQRRGQSLLNTTPNTSTEGIETYQFTKGNRIERKTFAQVATGYANSLYAGCSVLQATNNPPATGATFGTTAISSADNALPASFNTMADIMMYSDGARQHQLFTGDNAKLRAFVINSDSPLPRIPDLGREYNTEINDGISTTYATISAGDLYVFICTQTPANNLNYIFGTPNTASGSSIVKYWNGNWVTVSGLSDTTVLSGASLGQNGSMSWTMPTDELPHYMFGISGYWYLVDISGVSSNIGGIDSYTKLMLHCDGTNGSTTFTDSSGTGKTVTTYGAAQLSTTSPKFGTASGIFSGASGTYIDVAAGADFNFSASPFTIDCWFKVNSIATQSQCIMAGTANYTFGVVYNYLGSGKLNFWMSSNGSSWNIANNITGTNTTWANNTWYHVELSYDGTTYRVFLNGSIDISVASASYPYGTTGVRFATFGDGTFPLAGNVDECRVSKGIARHTAAFTLPVFAYSTIVFSATVTEASYSAPFTSMTNVWDGVLVNAIEALVYNSSKTAYSNYGSNSVTISKLAPLTDYIYFNSVDPIEGILVDVGATPNIIKATVTGISNISFTSNGTGINDTIVLSDNTIINHGFEAGQSVVITGSVNNNKTVVILSVTSNTIYVAPGTLVTEANTSATLTFSASCSISTVEAYTTTGWSAVTSLEDNTLGFTQSGFISWNRTSVTPAQTQFNKSVYYSYWYRIKTAASSWMGQSVNIGIQTIPYFNITKLGIGVCNGVWKNRAMYTFNQFSQYIYVSRDGVLNALNGIDYGILVAGDGRANKVLCIKPFYNEVITWQEERGKGGCTTLFEGYSPTTFGKLKLSDTVGIMNAKCATVVDGVMTTTETNQQIKTLAFWLSRFGVMVTDGRGVFSCSADISNYFSPTKPECIRYGYEGKMWLNYDQAYNVIRVGLVSGSTATEPNIFPVYDLIDGVWSFDTLGQGLSYAMDVEADSGNIPVIQIGIGSNDGYLYQCNNTLNDVNTAIDAQVTAEIDNKGKKMMLKGETLRVKAQTGNLAYSVTRDGESSALINKTFNMAAVGGKNKYTRFRRNENLLGTHFSVNMRHNGTGESCYLEDIGFEITEVENNT